MATSKTTRRAARKTITITAKEADQIFASLSRDLNADRREPAVSPAHQRQKDDRQRTIVALRDRWYASLQGA
jgi:hypothetical protein